LTPRAGSSGRRWLHDWQTAGSVRHRFATHYKREYGLTPEQATEMRASGCGIRGRLNGGGRHGQPHVDHDHATEAVRGALCDDSNFGIGKIKDDPVLLRAAADYLGPGGVNRAIRMC
jgi:hypothetical protein